MKRAVVAALPSDEEPLGEFITRRSKRFERRANKRKAEKWLPIQIPEHQGRPFAIAFFGDMHADDEDCNVPLLKRDLGLVAKTDGMFGVHIGDALNNWVGRLQRLNADMSTTVKEARRFAKYIMNGSGVSWLWWILGNHDVWNEGDAIYGLLRDNALYLPFWEAKIEIRCGRQSWRVHAAHDFRGQSDWNITHGPLKASYKASDAELLICGHKHDWGTQSFEIAGKDRVVHVARARGYKWADKYATERGFQSSQNGATVVAIFNPAAKSAAARIVVVPDLLLAAEMLTAMRTPRVHPDVSRSRRSKRVLHGKRSKGARKSSPKVSGTARRRGSATNTR